MASYASPVSGARKLVRRRLIVDAPFQLRALLPLILFVAIYLALMGLTFYRLHTAAAAEPDPGVRAILAAQLNNLHLHFWPVLGVAGLLAIYYNLYWSLRVAGPLYRLHRTLSELGERGVKDLRRRRRPAKPEDEVDRPPQPRYPVCRARPPEETGRAAGGRRDHRPRRPGAGGAGPAGPALKHARVC